MDFFSTVGGQRFIAGTMPRIAQALEDIAEQMKLPNSPEWAVEIHGSKGDDIAVVTTNIEGLRNMIKLGLNICFWKVINPEDKTDACDGHIVEEHNFIELKDLDATAS